MGSGSDSWISPISQKSHHCQGWTWTAERDLTEVEAIAALASVLRSRPLRRAVHLSADVHGTSSASREGIDCSCKDCSKRV